jgi:hypothetical protein
MGEHDAASVVGQLAGIGQPTAAAIVTPEQLVARFCGDVAEGLVAAPGVTTDESGATIARGHCGYIGGRGDSMVVGFDDGYDWMGYLGERGWRDLAAKGDWPYLVYMAYVKGDTYAIAEYCEGDLTVWTFPTAIAATAFYRGLKDCP